MKWTGCNTTLTCATIVSLMDYNPISAFLEIIFRTNGHTNRVGAMITGQGKMNGLSGDFLFKRKDAPPVYISKVVIGIASHLTCFTIDASIEIYRKHNLIGHEAPSFNILSLKSRSIIYL